MEGDTIFAPATPPGRGAIAVIRISGPHALTALERLAGEIPEDRQLSRRFLRDSASGEVLDEAMVVGMRGPATATGEDVAELHLHGGRAVLRAVSDRLAAMPGLRLAEPGEFTRRAVLNDRIDLARAEGILDLVDAETEAQRRLAMDQMTGGLSRSLDRWMAEIVEALARLEAFIDFPDEDLPSDLVDRISSGASGLIADMDRALEDAGRAERQRDGVRIAILGVPNVGKSSLLNWLAQRDVAIVSTTAGTTRDVLEVHLDLNEYAVTVADTAGLRDTPDDIEAEGVRRALQRAASADLTLVLADATAGEAGRAAIAAQLGADAIAVSTKADLVPDPPPAPWIPISTRTGAGTAALMVRLGAGVAEKAAVVGSVALTRGRHREAVEGARDALDRGLAGLRDGAPLEIVAEDFRLATARLGRILGRVDVDQLLDRIFAEFCLGK